MYRAAELPTMMARDRHIPRAVQCFLVQLIRDWHNRPESREWMLEGEPDLNADLLRDVDSPPQVQT